MTKIRIREQDIKKMSYAVRAFNAKITRELKKNPESAEYLPTKKDVSEMWARIATREDYNRVIKSLQRATKDKKAFEKANVDGIATTKWQKKENQYNLRRANRLRKVEEVNIFGNIESEEFTPLKYNFTGAPTHFYESVSDYLAFASQDIYWEYEKARRKQLYYNTLVEIFEGTEYGGEIIKIVESLTPEVIIFGQTFSGYTSLEYLYKNSDMEYKEEQLLYWWRYAVESYNKN